MVGVRLIRALALGCLALTACQIYEPLLCEPCLGSCGVTGLECVEGVCISPTNDCGIQGLVCDEGYRVVDDACVAPVDVAVGEWSACALWPDGRVSCWGWNAGYSLGIDDRRIASRPVMVDGVEGAVEIAMKGTFVCVRTDANEVWCWGDNDSGQLGDRSVPSSAQPVRVPLPQGFVPRAIAAGYISACAIAVDDFVHCWGDNTENQLGYGFLDRASDRPKADAVAIGWGHGCLLRDGAATCWSSNRTAEIGGDDVVTHPADDTPVTKVVASPSFTCFLRGSEIECLGAAPTIEGGPWIDVEAGTGFVCGVQAGGAVKCFGALVPWLELDAPTPSQNLASGERLELGGGSGCFVASGRPPRCWGDEGRGLLASPHLDDVSPRTHPKPLRSLTLGDAYGCAVDTNDRLECWGANTSGRLGTSAELAQSGPTLVDDRRTLDVAADWRSACRLDDTGNVDCWGGAFSVRPGEVPTRVDGVVDAVAIDVGQWMACALQGTGAVWCWLDGVPPSRVQGLPPVRKISVGGATACGLDADQAVWCWGNNRRGQADGKAGVGENTIDVPVRIRELVRPIDVALADEHGCALFEDGTVWCWGTNERGEQGKGSTSSAEAPSPILDVDDAVAIDAGFGWSCAALGSGEVTCWGEERSERFGRERFGRAVDMNQPAQRPTKIQGVNGAIEVVVGLDGACAVRADRSTQCFGYDVFGTLSRRTHDLAALTTIRSPE